MSNGVLMYVLHEVSIYGLWDVDFVEFVYRVLVYGSSYPSHDGYKGLIFQLLFSTVSISGSYLVCL